MIFVNSLFKNHIKKNILAESKKQDLRCWEYLQCNKMLCPAFEKFDSECWFISKTSCTIIPLKGSMFQKIGYCLYCSYFTFRATLHPDGVSSFLSAQIQRYNFEALKKIYEREESFIETLNRIPDGVFTTDREFRITYFNPAAEKITGFSAVDAVGMYCKDVFKNTVCETSCALKRAIKVQSDILNQEYEITNIYGQKIPIICSTSAFRDKDGEIVGGLEIFKDISELKKLQNEIVASEQKYRRIFEGSHDMIFISTEQGKIRDINEAGVKMLGYSNKQEVLDIESVQSLYLRPEYRDKFIDLIQHKGYVKDYETIFKRKDGTKIHVLISGRKYYNEKTDEVEIEGIIKDITQRKLVEDDLKKRNRELSLINSIAVAMNHTMDINYILDVTLRNLLKIIRNSEGAIFLLNRDKRSFEIATATGSLAELRKKEIEIQFKDLLLMKKLFKEDVDLPPTSTFPPFHISVSTKTTDKLLWLKCFLIAFKGKAIGFFAFDARAKDLLGAHVQRLMGSLGNFLGGAIENVRLMNTISGHQQELQRLTQRLFATQEEERRRIARELHDEAGQSLTAINLALERLQGLIPPDNIKLIDELHEIRRMVLRASTEIRQLSYKLHPTLLVDLGLEPALHSYFKQIQARVGIQIDFKMIGFDRRLDLDMETTLYRFAQEALTNTLKHSGAEHFRLSIIKSYPNIIFLAEDDGCGFDPLGAGEKNSSLGLLGMRERSSLLGGTFSVKSQIGKGTKIRIEIPLGGRDHEPKDKGIDS